MNSSLYTARNMNPQDKEDALLLEILETIESDSSITQRHLATSLGVALGLANSCLRRCARRGFIKIHLAPANRYLYYLTPQGFAEKSRLTAKYLSTSFEFYRLAGDSCRAVFQRCIERDWLRVVLCGDSELAEIATLKIHGTGLQAVGIYDPGQQSDERLGLPAWHVFSQVAKHDALILTALVQPHDFLRELKNSVANSKPILIPSVLGLNNEVMN